MERLEWWIQEKKQNIGRFLLELLATARGRRVRGTGVRGVPSKDHVKLPSDANVFSWPVPRDDCMHVDEAGKSISSKHTEFEMPKVLDLSMNSIKGTNYRHFTCCLPPFQRLDFSTIALPSHHPNTDRSHCKHIVQTNIDSKMG